MQVSIHSRSGSRSLDRRRHGEDAGFSFVEMVVAIVLIGIVVVGLLASTRAAISASSRSREAGQVETALLNASDRVSRAPMKCTVGGYQEYVDSAIDVWQGKGTATVSVQHYVYNAAQGAFAPGTWSAATPCPAQPSQSRIQRITIGIVGPSGSVSRRVEVVKGDV